MRYIAYYGAVTSATLCSLIFLIVVGTMFYNLSNSETLEFNTKILLAFIATPLTLLSAIISAWIACDMKKRMKDL